MKCCKYPYSALYNFMFRIFVNKKAVQLLNSLLKEFSVWLKKPIKPIYIFSFCWCEENQTILPSFKRLSSS